MPTTTPFTHNPRMKLQIHNLENKSMDDITAIRARADELKKRIHAGEQV
jgi:hypothetical protein